MPSKKLKKLKKEIYEVRLLLDGLSAYNEIPTPIIELAISKTDQLKELLVELKKETSGIRETILEKEEMKTPLIDKNTLPEKEDAEVDFIPLQPTPSVDNVAKDDPKTIMDDAVEPELPEVPPAEIIPAEREWKELKVEIEEEPLVKSTGSNVQKNTAPKKNVIADTIASHKRVMNDVISDSGNHTVGKRIKESSIRDLKRAIPINDRFRFQRDLFNNNVSLFNETLSALNAMDTFKEAEAFIQQNFNWDDEMDVTHDFLALLNRRFVK